MNNPLICLFCCEDHFTRDCTSAFCINCRCIGHATINCTSETNLNNYVTCTKCPNTHCINDCPTWRIYDLKKPKNIKLKKVCGLCKSKKHFADDCFQSRSCFSIFTVHFKEMI